MRITNKGRFCHGVFNCSLGAIVAITMIIGKSHDITLSVIAMILCFLTGIGTIIDNVEKKEE